MNDLKENVEKFADWDYNIKVAGVKFKQEELAKIYDRDWSMCAVSLEPDPENPVDPNAIKVFVDGIWCGFLPAAVAKAVTDSELLKDSYQAALVYVTGGADNKFRTAKIAVRRITE